MWTRYAWPLGAAPGRLPDPASVDDEVRRYAGRAVPMQPTPEALETLEALRALGYTE